jgi:hypothetical protein
MIAAEITVKVRTKKIANNSEGHNIEAERKMEDATKYVQKSGLLSRYSE